MPDRAPVSCYELVGFDTHNFCNYEPSYQPLMDTIREKTDCICMWNPGSNARLLGSAFIPDMESAREDTEKEDVRTLYVNADAYSGEYAGRPVQAYQPETAFPQLDKGFGHGGSDYYSMYNFVQKILGDPDADIIDVYEALDMFLPGLFAYRSALRGSIPMEIPNLRDRAVRELYRNDTACADPKVAGDQLLPPSIKGTPVIDPGVYAAIRKKWEDKQNKQ